MAMEKIKIQDTEKAKEEVKLETTEKTTKEVKLEATEKATEEVKLEATEKATEEVTEKTSCQRIDQRSQKRRRRTPRKGSRPRERSMVLKATLEAMVEVKLEAKENVKLEATEKVKLEATGKVTEDATQEATKEGMEKAMQEATEVKEEATERQWDLPVAFDPCFPPLPRLAEEDRQDIFNKRWLSDDVMDLVHEFVRRVRPETRGLYACAGAFTLDPMDPADDTLFLQIINRHMPSSLTSVADYFRPAGTHWLLATNFGAGQSCLLLYDSMLTSASPSTCELMRHLLSRSPKPSVTFLRVQQQQDSYSCGMYAIAFMFCIAVREDRATRLYDRKRMATHLLECLEQGRLKTFPSRSVSSLQQGCGTLVNTLSPNSTVT